MWIHKILFMGLQVIQPTPEMSPTASERNLNEDHTVFGLQVPGIHDQMHNLSVNNLEIGMFLYWLQLQPT